MSASFAIRGYGVPKFAALRFSRLGLASVNTNIKQSDRDVYIIGVMFCHGMCKSYKTLVEDSD